MSMKNIATVETAEQPAPRRVRRRWDWDAVPPGTSFEFDDAKPQAVLASFGAHLMRGKYRIKHLGGGRYKFWRLKEG